MPRIPRAAETLIVQATQGRPGKSKFSYTPSDLDGLGVYRTIEFDKNTSKWLAPLLEETQDARIESVSLSDDGVLAITFSPRTIADRRDSFTLNEADVVDGD